jgi:hypothetical protein
MCEICLDKDQRKLRTMINMLRNSDDLEQLRCIAFMHEKVICSCFKVFYYIFIFVFIFHPKNHCRMILDTSKKEDLQKRERKKERKKKEST